ncbi:MAG: glycosyltransferase, partial [bacterium]
MASERRQYDVSFFCPAYFDEGNIEGVVRKALDVLGRHARRFEIIIVNDGSPDGT